MFYILFKGKIPTVTNRNKIQAKSSQKSVDINCCQMCFIFSLGNKREKLTSLKGPGGKVDVILLTFYLLLKALTMAR